VFGSQILTRRRGPVDATLPRRVLVQGQQASVQQRATEETARGLSAYRRGQRLIARTIGMLPLVLERSNVLTSDVLPLMDRPVPWMSRQAAIESMIETLIDWGNYFAVLVQFDPLGQAQGIVPVHPRDVAVTLTRSGLLYRVGGEVYSTADVMHIRAGAPAGELLGRGVLETSATVIGTARAVTSAASYFYADGVYPAGVLEVEDPDIPEDEAELLRDRFISKARRGQPVVLPAGVVWKPVVSPNAEQAQLAAAAEMSRREIADLLDLDGDWLGVPGNSLTYANIVDRVDNLVRFTCQPWMVAIEDAFTELTPARDRVQFDTEELFRAQTTQRYADYAVALQHGILTHDEVRAEEHRPPLPPADEGVDIRSVAEVLQKLYLATPGKVVVSTEEARDLVRRLGLPIPAALPPELATQPQPPQPGGA
jgi:HK97 family phage portal protein